jgi:hypothetical protein
MSLRRSSGFCRFLQGLAVLSGQIGVTGSPDQDRVRYVRRGQGTRGGHVACHHVQDSGRNGSPTPRCSRSPDLRTDPQRDPGRSGRRSPGRRWRRCHRRPAQSAAPMQGYPRGRGAPVAIHSALQYAVVGYAARKLPRQSVVWSAVEVGGADCKSAGVRLSRQHQVAHRAGS